MKPSEELQKELLKTVLKISHASEDVGYFSGKKQREEKYNLREALWNKYQDIDGETFGRLDAYDMFYDNISCLFAEGVEFMDKVQLYDAFKAEFLKLKERLK